METMKKLIELDATLDALREVIVPAEDIGFGDESTDGYNDGINMAVTVVSGVPTVDAVPIRHGHWVTWYEEIYDSFGIGYAPHYKCSECDTEYDQYDAMRMNYCPNCGVKLDGKDGDT